MDNRVLKLIDILTEAWSKCLPKPFGDETFMAVGDTTHCNQYVHYVATKMGYTKFQPDGAAGPMMANEICDMLDANTEEWMPVGGGVAQWHANNGALVVASWKNFGGHGHVSVVFPGELGTSGNWHTDEVPKMANVGPADRSKIGIGANWCFHDIPKFFVLKATL